ncbi:MAG: IS200/IS605 family transposase [Acidobacteriota bacterium]|nr:IS200/IS605 family transposase [Acidobacteriota bacterium]
MPHIQVWIHYVWSTKNREPFLTKKVRPEIIDHLKKNAQEKEIHLDFIGGYVDHLHSLISMKSGQQIEAIAQMLKGESSHWINKNKICQGYFGWQDEYFAASVSPPDVPAVRRYIANQEEHHKKVSFQSEFKYLLQRAGFE